MSQLTKRDQVVLRWFATMPVRIALWACWVVLATSNPHTRCAEPSDRDSLVATSESAPTVEATPLVDAVERKQWSRAADLVNRDNVAQAQADGMTALHWAVHHENVELAKQLLEIGADANAATVYGITPLAIAAEIGHSELIGELLAGGARPNPTLAGNVTCLMLAAKAGHVAGVEALLQAGAEVDARQRSGQTALMWAAAQGHAAVVQALLDAGADASVELDSGFTAMLFAARQGRIEAAMTLLDHGVDVNSTMSPRRTNGRNPRKGMSALMLAVESAHYELALRLIDRGANPNDETSGYAPLHALSWVRRAQRGDNPEGDPEPLGSGAVSSLEFVRAIVARGANVNMRLRRGSGGQGGMSARQATPFLFAAHTVDLPYMELLLELGADPTIPNVDECTALMAAAGVGVKSVDEYPGTVEEVEAAVRMLVDLGLDINAVDKNGETAMHGAAYRCFPSTVLLVASLGAKPATWDHENKYGWSPMKIAQGYRPGSFKPSPDTIAALKQVGSH